MITIAFALLLLALLSSCSNNKEKVLVVIDSTKIDKTSAANTEMLSTSIVGDLLFNPILFQDARLSPHNVLAEDVKVLSGNKVIEVKLRDGIRFHNGREFNASDIHNAIDNAMKLNEKNRELFKGLQVEVLDKTRFRLKSDSPIRDPYILLNNIGDYESGFSEALVGTGPFRFGRWLDNGLELVANKDYFEGKPKIDKVVYIYEDDEKKRLRRLLSGEADLMVCLSPGIVRFLEKDNRFHLNKISGGYYTSLFFNTGSSLFSDGAVRKAVSMAINRERVIDKGLMGAGTPAYAPFKPEIMPEKFKKNNFEFRPREAAKLLADAGWRKGNGDILEKNGIKLRFSFYYNADQAELKKVVDIIQQQLFEAGIEARSVPIMFYEFMEKNIKAGDYDAYLGANSEYEENNFTTWHSSFIAKSEAANFSRYSNREVDLLLEKIRESSDIGEKKKLYLRIQEALNEDVPAAFLYNTVIYTAASRRFKGAEEFVGNVYSVHKIKDWSINEDIK